MSRGGCSRPESSSLAQLPGITRRLLRLVGLLTYLEVPVSL
eukprot:gene1693-biopygen11055